MSISRLLLAAALAIPFPLNATGSLPTGLFVATLLNSHPLPRIERVPSQDGWEHWFKLEEGLITLRPDGKFIAFRKPYKDTMNLWVKKAEEPFDKARLITAETKRPIRSYFWSRDSKYILFVNDFGGDENFNVFAVDPTAAGRDPLP